MVLCTLIPATGGILRTLLGYDNVESYMNAVDKPYFGSIVGRYGKTFDWAVKSQMIGRPAIDSARHLIDALALPMTPEAYLAERERLLQAKFLKTQRHGDWFTLFDTIVTGDDPAVMRGKPAPDIFLTAAERLDTAPARCLVFEDAPSGLAAGLAAGMNVVAVPDPAMDRAAYTGARQILETLNAFDPAAWQLPPRSRQSG